MPELSTKELVNLITNINREIEYEKKQLEKYERLQRDYRRVMTQLIEKLTICSDTEGVNK
jgi:N-acetylglutamate synthase/N-acetylornithine aminotransferase